MATHHAAPAEVVNLANWADDLPEEHSKAIAKTKEMELARLVLRPGEVVGNHHIDGPLVVHCITGSVHVSAMGSSPTLREGELLYLPPGEKFELSTASGALILITFVFVD